ncbi:hypothetical protein T11_7284, partial [Trichinella zimbabwensis]
LGLREQLLQQGRLCGAVPVAQLCIGDHFLFDLSNLQFNAHLLAVVGERFAGRQFIFAGEEQKSRRLFTVPHNHHLQQAGHQRHAHRYRPQPFRAEHFGQSGHQGQRATDAEHDLQHRAAHATVLDRRELADEHRRQTQRTAQRDAQQQSTNDEQLEGVHKFGNHRQRRTQSQSFCNKSGQQRADHGSNLQSCTGQRPQYGHL